MASPAKSPGYFTFIRETLSMRVLVFRFVPDWTIKNLREPANLTFFASSPILYMMTPPVEQMLMSIPDGLPWTAVSPVIA